MASDQLTAAQQRVTDALEAVRRARRDGHAERLKVASEKWEQAQDALCDAIAERNKVTGPV